MAHATWHSGGQRVVVAPRESGGLGVLVDMREVGCVGG